MRHVKMEIFSYYGGAFKAKLERKLVRLITLTDKLKKKQSKIHQGRQYITVLDRDPINFQLKYKESSHR